MNYPNALPLTDIQGIVQIIKDNAVAAQKSQLAKHLWIVQGYAQGSILGDPDAAHALLPQALVEIPDDMPGLVDVLEGIIAQHAPGVVAPQALDIPVAWLLQLVLSKLMELLVAYLKTKI